MNKSIFIWILILLALGYQSFAIFPVGEKNDPSELEKDDFLISIRAPKTVTPGKFATFILKVSNEYDFPLNLKVSVDKPNSWNLMSKQEFVNLSVGESQNVVFLMEIDRACEIGDQVVNFNFYDINNDVRLNEQIITAVENIHKILVRPLNVPRYVVSGEKFTVDYEIKNLGNCVEEFSLRSINSSFRDKTISLAPNSVHIEQVEERALDNLKGVGYSSVGISVVTTYQKEYINSVSTVKTFPVNQKKSDKYHRFPIAASVIYFGAQTSDPYQGNFQVEFKGRGNLDMNARHMLDFTVRAPDRLQISRVGNYDQYSAEYTYVKSRLVKTSVRVGDFSYNLTDLTEQYRWARGVGATHTREKLEVGAFVNSPRFFSEIDFQYGTYAKYALSKKWTTQASFMQKYYNVDVTTPASLISIINKINLAKHKIEFEISQGSRNGVGGYAGLMAYQTAIGRLSFSTNNIYADKNYPGFFTNSILSNTTLNYRINQLGFFSSFFYNESNPQQDTIFTVAPYSINIQSGVSWFPNREISSRLSYVYRFREDRFPVKKFAYRENGIRYLASYQNNTWNAQINGEFLQTENLLILNDNNISSSYDFGGRVSKTFFTRLTVGTFGQYLYTNRYSEDNQSIFLYGGDLGYSLDNKLKVRGSYRNNYLIDEYTTDRTLVDLGLNLILGPHMFDISTSHALIRNTVDRTDFYIRAKYTYFIGVPLKRKEGLYALDGQINSKNNEDVGGIVINIDGQAVITDQYGHFLVDDLPEGVHYLHVEGGSLNTGVIIENETPIEVFIYPNENNRVQLNVVRSGTVKGKVNFSKTQMEEFRKEQLPIFIVKASKGNSEFLTYSNTKGEYRFSNLAPGQWQIRIVDAKSTDFVLTQNNIQVNIQSGKTEEVDFEMKKKERKIQFSDKVLNLNIKKD